jgi:hypothetical protein
MTSTSRSPALNVCGNGVDLAFCGASVDGEVHRGDVVLHRPDVGPGGGDRIEELVGGPRCDGAMVVGGVGVVEVPQVVDIATIDRAAVAVHELAQLKLVEHFLQLGF